MTPSRIAESAAQPLPAPAVEVPRLGLRRGAIIAGVFWLTFAGVHYPEPGWNVNSRFALTRAIVDKGTFVVDGYVDRPGRDWQTQDRSIKDGRYYSDKIIGTSLLGVPPYALVKLVCRLFKREAPVPLARYVTTVLSVGICAAVAGATMASLLVAFGATVAEAFLLAIAMSFGTMLWGYSGLFYSYLPAICFYLLAYNVLLRGRLENRHEPRRLFVAGVCLGASLLCEYTVGIIAVALSAYAFWYAAPKRWVALLGLGAALPLSLFAAYTLICFGEICIPYKYLEDATFAAGMGQGLQGITRFRLAILYYITVHPYRGLFVLSPVLALSLVGLTRMFVASPRFRVDAALCAGVFIGYLWFNSSYYMWWGGWAMGPRHLIPALPFLIPPLLWMLRWHVAGAWAVAVGLAASIWLCGVPTLVDPQTPHGPYHLQTLLDASFFHSRYLKSPVFTGAWPAFFSGHAAWNDAMPVALRGPWYFLALTAAWIAAARALLRSQHATPVSSSGMPVSMDVPGRRAHNP